MTLKEIIGWVERLLTNTANFGSTQERESILKSMRDRLPRALSDGTAAYILAVLLGALGLAAAHIAWARFVASYDSMAGGLESMLKGRHEAGRQDRYFGVIAALMGELNSELAKDDLCPSGQGDCDRIDQFLDAFAHLAQSKVLEQTPEVIAKEAHRVVPQIQEAELVAALTVEFGNKSAARLIACEGDRDDDRLGRDEDFGPMRCEADWLEKANPRLFVSPLIPFPDSCPPPEENSTAIERRLCRAQQVSKLLGPLGRAVLAGAGEPVEGTHNFVQAYLISADNLLRIWQRDLGAGAVPNTFPRTRSWTAASYYTDLVLSEEESHVSAGYVDYAGFGIVRTKCRAVFEWSSGMSERRLLGVVCADNTIPLGSLAVEDPRARAFPLLCVKRVKASLKTDRRVSRETLELLPLDDAPIDRLRCKDDEHELADGTSPLKTRLSRVLDRVLDRHATSRDRTRVPAGVHREITDVELDGELYYFVPTGGAKIPAEISGLVIKAEVPAPRNTWYVLSSAALLLAAVLVAAGGAVLSRRQSEGELIADVLRSMEVGVIIVAADDRIEGSNDAGEEVLGVPLPKIGPWLSISQGLRKMWSRNELAVEERFDQLIDTNVWLDLGDGDVEAIDYQDEIPAQRVRGEGSSYYARLVLGERKDQWIRCSAAPISGDHGEDGRRIPRTFGIVQAVAIEMLPQKIRDSSR